MDYVCGYSHILKLSSMRCGGWGWKSYGTLTSILFCIKKASRPTRGENGEYTSRYTSLYLSYGFFNLYPFKADKILITGRIYEYHHSSKNKLIKDVWNVPVICLSELKHILISSLSINTSCLPDHQPEGRR